MLPYDALLFIDTVQRGVRAHLDSLHQVEIVGKHFPGSDISVRLKYYNLRELPAEVLIENDEAKLIRERI